MWSWNICGCTYKIRNAYRTPRILNSFSICPEMESSEQEMFEVYSTKCHTTTLPKTMFNKTYEKDNFGQISKILPDNYDKINRTAFTIHIRSKMKKEIEKNYQSMGVRHEKGSNVFFFKAAIVRLQSSRVLNQQCGSSFCEQPYPQKLNGKYIFPGCY